MHRTKGGKSPKMGKGFTFLFPLMKNLIITIGLRSSHRRPPTVQMLISMFLSNKERYDNRYGRRDSSAQQQNQIPRNCKLSRNG